MQHADPRRCRGFTLLELVVGLVISTIVIGFAVALLTTPVDAYYAQTRRSELVEHSERVRRTLERDLGMAVPNSVRVRNGGNRAVVEMLIADAVTFYRPKGTLGASAAWTDADRELDFDAADDRLSVFGRIDPQQTANAYTYPDRYLVVNNSGTGTDDAYRLARVITPAPVTINVARDPATYAATGEEQLTFAPAFRFRNRPPDASSRMFLVRGPVAYICNLAAATLRRYDGHAITNNIPANESAPQLNADGVRNTLLATGVTACSLTCPGTSNPAPRCLKALNVEIGLSNSTGKATDATRIYQQLPVDNVP